MSDRDGSVTIVTQTCVRADSAEAFAVLGHVMLRTDRFENAAQCFERAIEIDPDRHQGRLKPLLKALKSSNPTKVGLPNIFEVGI